MVARPDAGDAGADLVASVPEAEARFAIDHLPFTNGRYLVSLVLQEPAETREYDRRDQELAFEVNSGGPVHGRVVLDLSLDCRPCG